VLHPNQFHVNEAWIAFKLNDTPISAGPEGEFNLFALMDAASCFILSTITVSVRSVEPSVLESRRLLKEGKAHKHQLPKTLFIPSHESAGLLAAEAEHQGITVVRVSEDQLLLFLSEARESFRERFGGGSADET